VNCTSGNVCNPSYSLRAIALACAAFFFHKMKSYFFYFWNEAENEIRFVTSFDTTEEDIQSLLQAVKDSFIFSFIPEIKEVRLHQSINNRTRHSQEQLITLHLLCELYIRHENSRLS